jgi:hypothetical protein
VAPAAQMSAEPGSVQGRQYPLPPHAMIIS